MSSTQFNQLILDALENERRYTAKELHDGVAQTTLQLGLQASICRKLLDRGEMERLDSEMTALQETVQRASNQVKILIQDLRPPMLEEDDASLNDYIRYAIEIHRERGGVPVDFRALPPDEAVTISQTRMLGLLRIVQEGLLNVRKHAQAEHVRLTLSQEQENLYMTIADDGQGFDSAEVEARPTDRAAVGLVNLKMRTEAVGGKLTLTRDATAKGTKITVILPL